MSEQLELYKAHRTGMLESLWAYSRSQVELWRKLPWLALHADGLGGYSSAYATCYHQGLWLLDHNTPHGYYRFWVDCDTGNFMRSNRMYGPEDYEVLEIRIENLDAQKEIDHLEKRIEKGHSDYVTMAEVRRVGEWHDEKVALLGLQKRYVRTKPIAEPSFQYD